MAREMNSGLPFLPENGKTVKKLKFPLGKVEKRVLKLWGERDARKIMQVKPKSLGKNASTPSLILRLVPVLDTGCRIEGTLTLRRDNEDLDAPLVPASGKGKKSEFSRSAGKCEHCFATLIYCSVLECGGDRPDRHLFRRVFLGLKVGGEVVLQRFCTAQVLEGLPGLAVRACLRLLHRLAASRGRH